MTTKTDGGPAFPFGQTDHVSGQLVNGWGSEGMTLRDYFAAKALPLAFERWRYNITKDLGDEWHWKDSDWDYVAYLAYGLADAMLKAREQIMNAEPCPACTPQPQQQATHSRQDSHDSDDPSGADGYAYRYRHINGGTVLRFNHGEEVNGSRPIEAVPFWFKPQPTQIPEGRQLAPKVATDGAVAANNGDDEYALRNFDQSSTAFPPLDLINRPTVETVAAAFYLNRKPQTLRVWACFGNGPIKPLRVNGRLAWKVQDIKDLMEGWGMSTRGAINAVNTTAPDPVAREAEPTDGMRWPSDFDGAHRVCR